MTNCISTGTTNTGISEGIGSTELVLNRLQYQMMNISLIEFHYLWVVNVIAGKIFIWKNECIPFSWYCLETIWRQFYSNGGNLNISYHRIKWSLIILYIYLHRCMCCAIIKWKSIQCKCKCINKCVNLVESIALVRIRAKYRMSIYVQNAMYWWGWWIYNTLEFGM